MTQGLLPKTMLLLAVFAAPDAGAPANVTARLYRLIVGDDIRGRRAVVYTVELAAISLTVDWRKPVDMQLQIQAGKCECQDHNHDKCDSDQRIADQPALGSAIRLAGRCAIR